MIIAVITYKERNVRRTLRSAPYVVSTLLAYECDVATNLIQLCIAVRPFTSFVAFEGYASAHQI